MSSVSMRALLEAGAHFGHQTRFWHPKMAPYIYGQRNKIHIINLDYTLAALNESLSFVSSLASRGGNILFVGTKRAAQDIIANEAERIGMPYVSRRWLGGMLTNFKTVKQSIKKLKDSEQLVASGGLEKLSKKEGLTITRELHKLNLGLGGIKEMNNLPDAMFVVDVGFEKNAVAEARKLGIPVVGIVDTNNSPEGVDYVIPGNDDAIKSIGLYCSAIGEAVQAGRLTSAHSSGQGLEDFVEVETLAEPDIKENDELNEEGETEGSEADVGEKVQSPTEDVVDEK